MTTGDAPKSEFKFPGLTTAEVERSRAEHGSNVVTPPERDPWWKLYLEKFDDPVIRILMIAAFIAIGVGSVHGDYIEGIAIIIAILLATALAFINEYQAAREFEILNKTSDETPVRTIRNGGITSVPKRDLVQGDIVLVESGEELPADAEVLEGVSLQVNESRLTGESVPVDKFPEGQAHTSDHEPAYPAHRVLRGTTVADGYATLRLTAVGDSTEIGKAMLQASEDSEIVTPLNRQLDRLSKVIGIVGLGVAVATYVALVIRGGLTGDLALTGPQWLVVGIVTLGVAVALVRVWLPILYDGLEMLGIAEAPEWLEADSLGQWLLTVVLGVIVAIAGLAACWAAGLIPASYQDWITTAAAESLLAYFMIAVTIIVVAVPEGLAMSVTLSLAYSMRRMAANNILVRRMHACETIGAATAICSDKTGTLTMNHMRIHDADFPLLEGKSLREAGSNGDPLVIVEAISVNSTAHLDESADTTQILGNPTEGAMLLWLADQDHSYMRVRNRFEVLDQATFTTERKFMATSGRSQRGEAAVFVKGAPEIVLGRCTSVRRSGGPASLDDERSAIQDRMRALQRRGMRTLGLAYRPIDEAETSRSAEELAEGLQWLGFVAIEDPIRKDVPHAIGECHQAGVTVKIVTGDTRETAIEVGRQIGLVFNDESGEHIINGPDFAAMDDAQAEEAVKELKVLSRARPADKLRLVRFLQKQHHVVAVTGDGTNDAPALNHADVGLAMGQTGTSVAKEASDIILLDDSFRSIVNSILWGRSLYENIQRFILFQLTINVAALLIALLGPFIGVELPLTVIQMLWINLIMDTFAALALATEPPNPAVMNRPPRSPHAFIVTPSMAAGIFGTGILFVIILLGLLFYFQGNGITELAPNGAVVAVTAWELSVFFAFFVFLQFWNLFNARALGRNRSALVGLFENRSFMLIAISIFVGTILAVQFGGQEIFRTVPLDFQTWAVIIGISSLVLWIGEIARWLSRDRGADGDTAERIEPSTELASVS